MLNLKPVFKGSDSKDQIRKIIDIVGFPNNGDLIGRKFQSGVTRLLRSLSGVVAKSWGSVLPEATVEAIDLIRRLLMFAPERRATVKHCLAHSYVSRLQSDCAECEVPPEMDWSFDEPVSTADRLRELLLRDGYAFLGQSDAVQSQVAPRRVPRGTSWADMLDDE